MNINIIYVCCLSRMMRKYHVRFLEGKAPAMGLTYSTSSGDPDTSKTAASWFGACIFLIVAATILRSFFL